MSATDARQPRPAGRRRLLQLGLSVALAAVAAACGQADRSARGTGEPAPEGSPTTSTGPSPSVESNPRVLVVYYSRPGENYYYGERTWLDVGNTEVVATTITELIDCDVFKIEAADPYPDDYDQTVARNAREQEQDARPEIAGTLPDPGRYDVVLLGSPIWNVRAPMIMSTFTEALDLTGKTIHPFTTHAMSGLGTTERDYAATCPGATIGEGIAIQGEKAAEARPELIAWLRRVGLSRLR